MNDPILIVENQNFSNAWAEAVKQVMKNGNEITFGGKLTGKNQIERKVAKELEAIIKLEDHALQEAINGVLHPKFPTREKHLDAYVKEWDRGYDWKKQGFEYNYENRCEGYIGFFIDYDTYEDMRWHDKEVFTKRIIDQWKLALEDVINQIETGIQSNRNVIVVGNPSVDRFDIPDAPPCLREIWIRWNRKNGIDVKTTWRSRDLFSAWMSNIIGLLSAVHREIIIPLTLKYGTTYRIASYTEHIRSLHIYEPFWDDAMKIKKVAVNPMYMHK